MARTLKIMIAIAGLAVGCARPHGLADTPSPKPEGEAAGAEAKPEGEAADEGAIEAMVFPTSARAGEGRPEPDALSVRVWAPTPIGALREDAREAYRIVLQAENDSERAIDVHPAWARTRIHRRDRIVEGCLSEPVEVPETAAVGREGALFVSLPAPCALDEPGRYEVFVDLSIGARFGAEDSIVRTGRTEIRVDRSLEDFRGDELPPVTPEEAD